MSVLSFKIALPIIIAGVFIMVSLAAVNFDNLTPSFYIIFCLLVIHVFLFGFSIGQNFSMPVKRLLKRADDLNNGDFKSRVYLESKDEIGQLSNVFNKIAEKLEESSTENERIKKSVGIRVEAETKALRETISALEQKVRNRTLENQQLSGDVEKFQDLAKVKGNELISLKLQVEELKNSAAKHPAKKQKKIAKEPEIET